MNRMMILAAFLASALCAPIMALNEEQREILYTLSDLGQSFDSVPMIAENVEMFIGMLQMNMQITKAKMKNATSKKNKALFSAAGIVVTTGLLRGLVTAIITDLLPREWKHGFNCALVVCSAGNVVQSAANLVSAYSVFATYDAFKAKNELEASLARDKKILRKLEELRSSLPAEQQSFDVKGMMQPAE